LRSGAERRNIHREPFLRRITMRTWAAVWLALISTAASGADEYPARPIRIIITVVPGGGADITARAIGQKLTEAWGQQVIVDNRWSISSAAISS
jgi:tripartite-type tricarboxylate transporter receptor subunit TctC